MSTGARRLIVLCPHFSPDIAPTGKVMTEIVMQWVALGHEVHGEASWCATNARRGVQ